MNTPDPNQYSVKEILTDFVLPALNDLREQQAVQRDKTELRLSRLESWKNKGIGAFVFLTAILIPICVPVIITLVKAK